MRTFDPAIASLHVLGVPTFASWLRAHISRPQTEVRHLYSMRAVAQGLAANPYFGRDAPFLVIMGHFYPMRAFGPELLDVLNGGNVILGTTDQAC